LAVTIYRQGWKIKPIHVHASKEKKQKDFQCWLKKIQPCRTERSLARVY
jgi:hypothetical protein